MVIKNFSIKIQGEFDLDHKKYTKLSNSLIKNRLDDFVKLQYPSSYSTGSDQIQFSNQLVRFKVRRGKNFLRAFHKGRLSITKDEEYFTVTYEGSLLRGLFLSAFYTAMVFLVFWYLAPQALFVTPVLFLLNYFFQVYLTHVVFPMSLAKELHKLLEEIGEG